MTKEAVLTILIAVHGVRDQSNACRALGKVACAIGIPFTDMITLGKEATSRVLLGKLPTDRQINQAVETLMSAYRDHLGEADNEMFTVLKMFHRPGVK